MKGDLLKGNLDLLLLAILETGPHHGYAVVEQLRLRSRGAFELPEGTVYPALHRLADRGWAEAEWVVHQGRSRKIYRLTPAGRGALAASRTGWQSFVTAVERTIGATP